MPFDLLAWIHSLFSHRETPIDARPRATSVAGVPWRRYLRTAVARVVGEEFISESAAEARVAHLGGSDLARLDEELRRTQCGYGRTDQIPADELRPGFPVQLFVASCDADGRVRERIVNSLRDEHSRLALAAVLIRCGDWVPQVQRAAQAALETRLREEDSRLLLGLADLVVRLRNVPRFEQGTWTQVLERELSAGHHREFRFRLLHDPDVEARKLGLALVVKHDPDQRGDVLRRAVRDNDVGFARSAFALARDVFDADTWATFVRETTSHAQPAMRAIALREFAELGSDDAADVLRRFLLDVARAPREAAAWYLRKNFGFDPATEWRGVLDAASSRHVLAAIEALVGSTTPDDVRRFAGFSAHRRADVRVAAMRGLVRANAPQAAETVKSALRDVSSRVVGSAVHLLGHGVDLQPAELAEAIAAARGRATQRILLRATHGLGKWEDLELLLQLVANDVAPAAMAADHLRRWLELSNRRFTPIATSRRDSLCTTIDGVQEAIGTSLASHLRMVVAAS